MTRRITNADGACDRAAQKSSMSRDGRSDSVHRSFAASMIVRGIGAVLTLSTNILLARLLGVAEYGRYMTLFSAAILLGSLAVWGTDKVLTRELAGSAGPANLSLVHWACRRVALAATLAIAIYSAWSFSSGRHQSLAFLLSIVLPGALSVGLSAFCMLEAGALNGFGAPLRSQSLLLVVRNTGLLALILAVMNWSSHSIYGAGQALWLQAGSFLVALVVGWLWIKSFTSGGARDDPGSLLVTRRWTVASHHFVLVTIASILVNRFDVILIAAVADNETTGVYAAGARLAQVALMAALAVNIVLGPRFAAAWTNGDHPAVRRLLLSGLTITIPIAFIEVIISAVLSSHISALFGSDYASAGKPFVWITLAYALWTMAAPGYALLSMSGSEKIVAALSWLVLVVNAAMILLLVPSQGATGAGVAMTAGYALTLPILAVLTRQKLKWSIA